MRTSAFIVIGIVSYVIAFVLGPMLVSGIGEDAPLWFAIVAGTALLYLGIEAGDRVSPA